VPRFRETLVREIYGNARGQPRSDVCTPRLWRDRRLRRSVTLSTEAMPAKRRVREALQVDQRSLQVPFAQVGPGTSEIRDQIELEEEPLRSRNDELCIHVGYLEGPISVSSSTVGLPFTERAADAVRSDTGVDKLVPGSTPKTHCPESALPGSVLHLIGDSHSRLQRPHPGIPPDDGRLAGANAVEKRLDLGFERVTLIQTLFLD
jgi:hypothetical protein